MANCRQCGTELPTFSFGESSPYCKTCRAQMQPTPKPKIDDVLAPVALPSAKLLSATNLLVTVNVLIFLVMVSRGVSWLDPRGGDLLPWGANYGPYTLSGQYWRIVASSFLHFGIVHIGLNMWCLWSLGHLTEKLLGAFSTVGIYLVTGTGASLLSLSWDPFRMSAGASGSIFGLAGVLIPVLYYGQLNLPKEGVRKLLGYVVRFALINLLYGLKGNVDNMAHLGGLVVGLVMGLVLARSYSLPAEERAAQRRKVIVVAACILPLLLFPIRKSKGAAVELGQAEQAMDHSEYSLGLPHLQAYVAMTPNDANGHGQLGYCYQKLGRFSDAMSEYERSLALNPNFHWVQLSLARLYASTDRSKEAVPLFRKALLGVDWDADDYAAYGVVLQETGDLSAAEDALRKSIGLDPNRSTTHGALAEVLRAEGKAQDAVQESKRAEDLQRQGGSSPAK